MPELNWNQTDLVEYLEVVPETNEFETEQLFTVQRNGLILQVSVWPLESVVYLDLSRVGSGTPLIGLALFVRGRVEYVKERDYECLRFHNALPAPNRFSYMDYKEDVHNADGLSYGLTVRLRVKPDIAIELERKMA